MTQEQMKESHSQNAGHAKIAGTLDVPILQFDFPKEIQDLCREAAWLERTGPISKTLVKHPDLRVVLVVMRQNMCMHDHRTAARISIQTLAGRIRLRLPDRSVELVAGQLLVLDQCVPHELDAEVDSAFLLTLSLPTDESVQQCRSGM